MSLNYLSAILLSILLTTQATANSNEPNTTNQSFNKAKKSLERSVYQNHRETIYCGAEFTEKKEVIPPSGFETSKYIKRSKKVEWEHVVPAENFGRAFKEWRGGHSSCVDSKGKSFKGRRCAEKVNTEYRYMQADMYNLYPAIGAVNALRSNYNFTMLPSTASSFGSCEMKIDNRKAEPPVAARGRIARTYLYMDSTYPRYAMSKQQKQLMTAWDQQFPISKWECTRAKRIAAIQKNSNLVVQNRCQNLSD
ncbi:endonuclease [Shewanella eurypsychrophilus]|uniref:Endonuclease n=1 Tax=Shewanella eurypsychrophilus TaxID=2593656 RepID=A0ABX6V1U7_9GAMM|nr:MULTISPECIES: endonuclease [Shewanella]QFU21282.1 endonuclease I [Shewanella sp. YLB-09]QPG56573.1 endonuclease [Shewanella eurypsychrophilus]